MKLILGIVSLLFVFPSTWCIKCSDTSYGKYDETYRESTIDEKIPIGWWKIPKVNQINTEEQSIKGRKECPELYQRYSIDHTFCKDAVDGIIEQGVTEEDKNIILKIHNTLRSKLASGEEARYRQLPSAANMMEMEWDDELAAVAQAHSNLCEFEHDTADQRAVENFRVGQNLLMSTSSRKKWNYSQYWYKEEVCFFFPEYIDPFMPDKDYGHFSQVAWARTWKVGCGYTSCQDGSGDKSTLYTCNYGPAGNMEGGTFYVEGEPCSQCPENTECSTEYPGLCKSLTEDGPQIARPSADEYLLFCDFSDEDPEECNKVSIEGSKNFSTRHIYAGNYKMVVLEAGEHITIDLGTAKNEGGFCPFLYGRFGPNNASDRVGSTVEFHFSGPGVAPMPPIELKSNGPEFSTIGLFMRYDGELQTLVTLTVEEDAAPQYFDIKYWGIQRGICHNNFYV